LFTLVGLQQNLIDTTINKWRKTLQHMCIQIKNILNICCELLIKLKKSWTNGDLLHLFPTGCSFLAELVIFKFPKVRYVH